MITLVIYQTTDGRIVSVITGSPDTVANQSPPDGYSVAEVSGDIGQYYNAVTGAVQDAPLS